MLLYTALKGTFYFLLYYIYIYMKDFLKKDLD